MGVGVAVAEGNLRGRGGRGGGGGQGRHVICYGYFISSIEMLCDIIIPAEVNEAMR